jgi:uncharacterized membrane protein
MDLISLLIVLIVFGLLAYVVQSLLPMPAPFKNAALAVLVLILVIYLLGGLHGHTLVLR